VVEAPLDGTPPDSRGRSTSAASIEMVSLLSFGFQIDSSWCLRSDYNKIKTGRRMRPEATLRICTCATCQNWKMERAGNRDSIDSAKTSFRSL
jgi:hypothetical protein